jgi:prepilin-type N-terminal cleavage/methylation domain-containing protein
MKRLVRPARRGFSLIEVLVSVAVMSFGLLSLAALQGNLFKSGAESRAQSIALAMASEKIEYFAGYRDRSEFQEFTDGNDAAVTVDGIAFTRSWTIQRYAYPEPTATTPLPDFTLLTSDTGETPTGYVSNNEFKRVQVKVGWTDATGASREVALESAIAALSPQDTAKVAKVSSTGGPRGPQIVIKNPANEEGVIPIAVGDGTDTAATNPKPVVAGSGNSERVIETSFDVLTYAALTGTENALAQSRVETVVAGCTCDYGNAPASTTRGKRPTYWNGLRYVVPEDATYAPPAGVAADVDVQSSQCTICCRDHHDPTGVAGAKFDPRRADHTQHQLFNTSTGQLGSLASTGEYTEACRMIRVDGIWRVAADMYNDYMNLLQTDNGADAAVSDYVPTAAATKNYQDFILKYLDTKFVAGASSTYNTVMNPAGSVVTGLETTYSINAPTTAITIPRPTSSSGTTTERWLHDRGLYIDYLEDEARQAVIDAKNDCKGTDGADPTDAQLQVCVLKVLPFTTINLTELADWTPASGTQIVVSNNDFRTSLASDTPVRGKVVPGSKPTTSTTTDAVASIRKSNSGVAVMGGGIDDDDASVLTDSQPFQPDGSWGGSDTDAGSGGSFSITLTSYAFNNVNPTFGVSPTATCNPATSGTTQPNPFTCTTQYTGKAQSITVGNYNYQINGTSSAALTCTGKDGDKTYPGTSYDTRVCRNYAISAVGKNGNALSLTPSVSNEGSTSETTTINFTNVANTDALEITFGAPVDTTQTTFCSYSGNGGKLNQYQVATADCP